MIPNDTLARTLWGEARGRPCRHGAGRGCDRQPRPQSALVGHDILSVCLEPYQFRCWNHSDPNRAKMLQARHVHRPDRASPVLSRRAARPSGQPETPTRSVDAPAAQPAARETLSI
jgi:hypothetical protein